jgi:hypothetical protein
MKSSQGLGNLFLVKLKRDLENFLLVIVSECVDWMDCRQNLHSHPRLFVNFICVWNFGFSGNLPGVKSGNLFQI